MTLWISIYWKRLFTALCDTCLRTILSSLIHLLKYGHIILSTQNVLSFSFSFSFAFCQTLHMLNRHNNKLKQQKKRNEQPLFSSFHFRIIFGYLLNVFCLNVSASMCPKINLLKSKKQSRKERKTFR